MVEISLLTPVPKNPYPLPILTIPAPVSLDPLGGTNRPDCFYILHPIHRLRWARRLRLPYSSCHDGAPFLFNAALCGKFGAQRKICPAAALRYVTFHYHVLRMCLFLIGGFTI